MSIRRKLVAAGSVLVVSGAAAATAVPIVSSLQAGAESEANRPVASRGGALDFAPPSGVLEYARAVGLAHAVDYVNLLRIQEAAASAHSSVRRRGGTSCGSNFDCFKSCTTGRESHGDYGAVSSSGTYRGAWQFDQRTWEANGGFGDPAAATPAQQDAVAYNTWLASGSQPWGGRC